MVEAEDATTVRILMSASFLVHNLIEDPITEGSFSLCSVFDFCMTSACYGLAMGKVKLADLLL